MPTTAGWCAHEGDGWQTVTRRTSAAACVLITPTCRGEVEPPTGSAQEFEGGAHPTFDLDPAHVAVLGPCPAEEHLDVLGVALDDVGRGRQVHVLLLADVGCVERHRETGAH